MFLTEVTIGTYKAYKPLYIRILLNTNNPWGQFSNYSLLWSICD